ncbi:hypothetical protein M514_28475, partial [Trichuris suis]
MRKRVDEKLLVGSMNEDKLLLRTECVEKAAWHESSLWLANV